MPLAVLNAGIKRFASSRLLSMYICEEQWQQEMQFKYSMGKCTNKVQKFQVRTLDLSKRASLLVFGRIYSTSPTADSLSELMKTLGFH